MKNTKTKIYEEVKTVINEDGEIITAEFTTVRKVTKETFLQVYLDDFYSLMRIREGNEYKLVLWIGKNMNFDNEIILVKEIKNRIANEIECNVRTIDNSIRSLVSKGILIKSGRAIFTLNPHLFFKGNLDQRNKLKKLIKKVEYDFLDEIKET